MSIDGLPNEITKYILNYLRQIDLVAVLQVSKRLNTIANTLITTVVDDDTSCINGDIISLLRGDRKIIDETRGFRLMCMYNYNYTLVKLLIGNKIYFDFESSKQYFIYLISFGFIGACEGGCIDIVKLLIENRHIANTDINYGFIRACYMGCVDVVRFLISKGVINTADIALSELLRSTVEIDVRVAILNIIIDNNIVKLPDYNYSYFINKIIDMEDMFSYKAEESDMPYDKDNSIAISESFILIKSMINKKCISWDDVLDSACEQGNMLLIDMIISECEELDWNRGLSATCRRLNVTGANYTKRRQLTGKHISIKEAAETMINARTRP